MAYFLSALSAILLIASFKPIDWWWLAFVALVPYAFILYSKERFSMRQSMVAGAMIAVIFSTGISFAVLTQFHWYAMAEIMTIGIQLLWIPISILAVVLGSLGSWVFRRLQSGSIGDTVLFAAIWTLIELIRRSIFMYFDYGLLGYAAHAMPIFMRFASIGGVPMVSFLIALVNGFLAWVLIRRGLDRKAMRFLCAVILAAGAAYSWNYAYLYSADNGAERVVSVSTIQINERKDPFGAFDPAGNFILSDRTQNMIRAAALQEPDFLIYPFNLVGGIITDGTHSPAIKDLFSGTFLNMAKWLKTFLPQKTNFVMWTNTVRDGGSVKAEVNFWNSKGLEAFYNKRELFPFIDFTPTEAQKFGIYTTPVDYIAGQTDQIIGLDGIKIGNLVCSELNTTNLAMHDSPDADVIFAIGSAALFRDNVMGDRNIVLAQFRAAENNVPLVRSDRKGPSAVIDKDGTILSSMPFGKDGVLKYDLKVPARHSSTIYRSVGDWLMIVAISGILLFYIFRKSPPTRFL